jgi:ligand-binding sensor domain-containing protein
VKEKSFFGFGWFVVMLLSVLPGDKTHAQEYRFVNIDSHRGLSHNYVRAVYRDKMGFVWIGTESGLNRFDGYSIKIYRNDPADSSSLPSDYVERLFEAPGGKLGIITGSGLCLYNPVTETFSTDFRFLDKDSTFNPAAVTNIVHDNAGNYWILVANNGLLCYNEKRNKTVSLIHSDHDDSTISSNSVTSIAPHQDGSYWIAHSNGVVENALFDKGRLRVVKRFSVLPTSLGKIDRSLKYETSGGIFPM